MYGPFFIAFFAKGSEPCGKVSVKKKLGPATWRNLQKRRMRAILKEALRNVAPASPVVLVVMTKTPPPDFSGLREVLSGGLRRLRSENFPSLPVFSSPPVEAMSL